MTVLILGAYATLEDLDAAAKIIGFGSLAEFVGIESPTAKQVEDFIDDHVDDPKEGTSTDQMKKLLSFIAYSVTELRGLPIPANSYEYAEQIRAMVYNWTVRNDCFNPDVVSVFVAMILQAGPNVIRHITGITVETQTP